MLETILFCLPVLLSGPWRERRHEIRHRVGWWLHPAIGERNPPFRLRTETAVRTVRFKTPPAGDADEFRHPARRGESEGAAEESGATQGPGRDSGVSAIQRPDPRDAAPVQVSGARHRHRDASAERRRTRPRGGVHQDRFDRAHGHHAVSVGKRHQRPAEIRRRQQPALARHDEVRPTHPQQRPQARTSTHPKSLHRARDQSERPQLWHPPK